MSFIRMSAGIVLAALVGISFGPAAAEPTYPELELNYASHVPGSNVVSAADHFFASEIARRSDGRIKIEIYWNRSLAKQSEVLPLVAAGAIHLSTIETAQYGETPLMGFANALPLTWFDAAATVAAARDLYEHSAGIAEERKRLGIRILFTRHLPNYQLLCRRPYRTLAELQGAKLRSYGAYVPVMWQAIGANAVNVVASELYDGLEKGTFDCAYLPPPFLADYKLHEVARYLLDVPFGMIEFAPIIVGEDVWASWPPEVQQLLQDVGAETERFAVESTEAGNAAAIEKMHAEGAELVVFAEPEALRARVPDMLETWLARQEQQRRGPPAEEIIAIARRHLAKH